MQQGSGGSLPVASAHNMMYPSNTQNQPQGPQPNAQGQFFPHPGGPNPSPHMHSSGQPRQVTITHSQHMQNYPVITPNLMPYYPSTHGGSNLVYQLAQVSKVSFTYEVDIGNVHETLGRMKVGKAAEIDGVATDAKRSSRCICLVFQSFDCVHSFPLEGKRGGETGRIIGQ
ncbi:uncharacterized protein [Cherax quadricarinatus]|uniref:uncharacterized protein n=1 Tax=Cherax quadricarinatus TaxID=27406 RepID=UPI00387EDDA1